jgi:hypothetical protein
MYARYTTRFRMVADVGFLVFATNGCVQPRATITRAKCLGLLVGRAGRG